MTEKNYTQELLKAIEFEESELAKLCIENGADVNFDLGNGWTISVLTELPERNSVDS